MPTKRKRSTTTTTTTKKFYHTYLLHSANPSNPLSTYIGFTTHPKRRLRQHNGEIKGGAYRTHRRGRPWSMVAVVAGFPNKVLALQFEWAWQHPGRSRLLRKYPIAKKLAKRRGTKPKLEILSLLLTTDPFQQYGLCVHTMNDKIDTTLNTLLTQIAQHTAAVKRCNDFNTLPMYEWEKEQKRLKQLLKTKKTKKKKKTKISKKGTQTKNNTANENEDDENVLLDHEIHVIEDDMNETNEETIMCSAQDRRYCSICFDCLDGDDDDDDTSTSSSSSSSSLVKMTSTLIETTTECDVCTSRSHLICLAKMALKEYATTKHQLIPTISCCPMCDVERKWSQIVQQII
tara:strand:+ start:75 stop:1109 length:1035 start_codon:yes stop_codon:yes gene_type:complete